MADSELLAAVRHSLQARLHELALAVLHRSVLDPLLQRIKKLDIADGAFGLRQFAGHSFTPLGPFAYWPFDGRFDSQLPVFAGLGEEFHPGVSGPTGLGAVNDEDFAVGERDAFVQLLKARVVPFRDFARVDVGRAPGQ